MRRIFKPWGAPVLYMKGKIGPVIETNDYKNWACKKGETWTKNKGIITGVCAKRGKTQKYRHLKGTYQTATETKKKRSLKGVKRIHNKGETPSRKEVSTTCKKGRWLNYFAKKLAAKSGWKKKGGGVSVPRAPGAREWMYDRKRE